MKLSPELSSQKPHVVAFLGLNAPEDMRKERVQYLEQALRDEIGGRGYLVLEPEAVRAVCSGLDCPERDELVRRHGLEGVFVGEISSITRANFGVGYWNTVSGKLRLLSPTGVELALVDHSEREQGGLVFQSGQVIEGFQQTVRNAGDDAFNLLADKFAKTIALKLPRVEQSADESDAPPITAVETRLVRSGLYEVCANGQESALVSLVMNRQRTNLRSVSPGRFCGIYRIEPTASGAGRLSIEGRSPFGKVSRKEIALESPLRCDLGGKVELKRDRSRNVISVRCVTLAGRTQTAQSSCPADGAVCSAEKIVVYRSPSDQGPFTKVTELRDYRWSDPAARENVSYRVVAVDSRGVVSSPVTPAVTQ